MIYIAIVVGLGVVFGLVARHIMKPLADPTDGAKVIDMIGAVNGLAGLYIALVIVQASFSYNAANGIVNQEASAIDDFAESTEYVAQEAARQTLLAGIVCYARAVAGPEWEAMVEGKASPVPGNWIGSGPHGIRKTLKELGFFDPAFGLLRGLDQQRGDVRSQRLSLIRPKIHIISFSLLVFLVALGLAGQAYSLPRAKHIPQLVTFFVVAALYGAILLVIYSLDRPLRGAMAIAPTAMQRVADENAKRYLAAYGTTLPCDNRGQPL